jgi:hypothetical protein
MKMLAGVICALLATTIPGFAHGTESGTPVMASGGGGHIFAPIAPTPIGSPISNPVVVQPMITHVPVAAGALDADNRMRHPPRPEIMREAVEPIYTICRRSVPDLQSPQFLMYRSVPGGCLGIVTQNGLLPLPPAFLW